MVQDGSLQLVRNKTTPNYSNLSYNDIKEMTNNQLQEEKTLERGM